jgi:DNA-binding GntR family transcriptional regulator
MRLVPNSLHLTAADTLRDEIFAGGLAPGSFIDELALCDRLQISRTPLREALKVLTSEGLLRHEPRRGCFVNEITEQDLDGIFPVIALLEGRCAFEAARNASAADLLDLAVLHQQLQSHAEAGRIAEYYDVNFAIHEAIILLANNRWLSQSIADLRKVLKLSRLQSLGAPGRLQQSVAEHMAVFAALQRGDSEAADLAMRGHLANQREALRSLARSQRSHSARFAA